MRSRGLIVCLVVLCAAPALAADKKLTPAEQAEAVKLARIDAVAKEVFAAADHNHNDLLSKTEFPDAEALLEQRLLELGNQGVLGDPKKVSKDTDVTKASAAAPANLYKKNRISPSEFQLFARAMGVQADVMIAQNRTAQAAYQKQMQNSRGRRGRQVRTGTPVFLGP